MLPQAFPVLVLCYPRFMSTGVDARPPRKGGPKLTEGQRRAIVAEVALGKSQVDVAKQFSVNPNTVYSLVKSVRDSIGSALSTSWRSRLTDKLPELSVDAMELSITDKDDPHKAAATAIAHLKGIGVLAGDNNSTVNVFVSTVLNLPADWQSEYLSVDSTPNQATATATELPPSSSHE